MYLYMYIYLYIYTYIYSYERNTVQKGEGPPLSPFRIVVEVLEQKGWFHMKAWQNS